ncbi:MAG: FAD-dependent oxidoreductase, partial [Rhizobiales bacterium]|nr:FAD-dependent oxidoreductase [Hyphomicrobiales bacterium]
MSKIILNPDICIIGAGSGGLSVASAAAQMGVDVVLIERDKMGGDCLNYGCVPSKSLLSAAKSIYSHDKAQKYITNHVPAEVNYSAVKQHVADVIATIEPHDSVERFEGLGVKVIKAAGEFVDNETVHAADYVIKARRFIISTGSSAFIPPIEGLSDVNYQTNESIFDLPEKPSHLTIIGAGPIGLEMAQAHIRLGCEVTVIDAFEILGNHHDSFADVIINQLKAEGVRLLSEVSVEKTSEKNGKIIVSVKHTDGALEDISSSHLLVATGRAANISKLGLDKTDIEYDGKGVKVDNSLRTDAKKVYAIGDVVQIKGATFNPQFTHVANYHAGLVIRSILFRLPTKVNYDFLPWVIYTDPELAHVGLNADQAKQRYGTIKILSAQYEGNDRAIATEKTMGKAEFYVTTKGHVVGATILGENAGELISIL